MLWSWRSTKAAPPQKSSEFVVFRTLRWCIFVTVTACCLYIASNTGLSLFYMQFYRQLTRCSWSKYTSAKPFETCSCVGRALHAVRHGRTICMRCHSSVGDLLSMSVQPPSGAGASISVVELAHAPPDVSITHWCHCLPCIALRRRNEIERGLECKLL